MIKSLTIRHLATRIANDAIQHATTLAELEMLKNQKEVTTHGHEPIEEATTINSDSQERTH